MPNAGSSLIAQSFA